MEDLTTIDIIGVCILALIIFSIGIAILFFIVCVALKLLEIAWEIWEDARLNQKITRLCSFIKEKTFSLKESKGENNDPLKEFKDEISEIDEDIKQAETMKELEKEKRDKELYLKKLYADDGDKITLYVVAKKEFEYRYALGFSKPTGNNIVQSICSTKAEAQRIIAKSEAFTILEVEITKDLFKEFFNEE